MNFGTSWMIDCTSSAPRLPSTLGHRACPEAGRGSTCVHPGEGIGYDEPSATRAVEQADAFVSQTMQRLGTEPDQLYLLGFSQGSMIAHALLLRGSIIPAGVAACSGRLVDEVFAAPPDRDRLRDRRLFVSHGRFDDVIPVQCGQDIRDWYQSTGIDLEYHEYDMAHGLDQSCMQDLTAWFSKTIDG